jgi:hypothetical protein
MGGGAGGKSADPIQHPPQEPAPKRKLTADCFPPQYNTIRAARANTSTITPLGGIGGVGRLQVRLGIGAATGGFEVRGDTRQYSVQNYHVLNQKKKRVRYHLDAAHWKRRPYGLSLVPHSPLFQ